MQQKRVFAEMQTLGVDDGPVKTLAAAGTKRRTQHCVIRLLNVMFSKPFARRVHQIDCQPTRAELDTNQTQGSAASWTYFHDTYTTSRMDLGKIVSDLPAFAKYDPGIIVPHEAAKLRDMWKDVSGRYTLALSNSRVSGMYDNDFFSYCSGKIDILYMHELLLIRPNLLTSVEGRLPKRARLNTMVDGSDSDDEDKLRSKKQRAHKKSRNVKPDVIADILATIKDSNVSAEALELNCRFAQLVSTLSALMALRERIVTASPGVYTTDVLNEVEEDITHVRAKKIAMLKNEKASV
ncbi:hypothetical protein PRNP1_006045 [Phytophthora ramorum]